MSDKKEYKEIYYPVAVYQVHCKCPYCETGHMAPYNVRVTGGFRQNNHKFPHKCNEEKCGRVEWFKEQYPYQAVAPIAKELDSDGNVIDKKDDKPEKDK